jgi:hypothetical protein
MLSGWLVARASDKSRSHLQKEPLVDAVRRQSLQQGPHVAGGAVRRREALAPRRVEVAPLARHLSRATHQAKGVRRGREARAPAPEGA